MQQQADAYYRALSCPGVPRRLIALALLGVIAGCGGSSGPLPTGIMPAVSTDLTASGRADQFDSADAPPCARIEEPKTPTHLAMYQELNRYRAENGLQPLLYSQTLEAAADSHVEDLWVRDFFSHTNPDGEDPGDRAYRAGFCHWYVGENIAAGQMSVQHVMQAWKDSPHHDVNMLEPEYVYVGMGFSTDTFGRRYWGQAFAYDLP